jgi:ribonuclease HI
MEAYIYKITSPTNKVYIGKTINLKNRISRYKNLNCIKQRFLYNSLKKYGWDKHKFEIIHTTNKDELSYWERHFIIKFNSFYLYNKKGMNLTTGGEGNLGHKHSDLSKIKMRNKKINDEDTLKTVNQFSLDGKFIKKWENRFEAEINFSKKSSSIKNCLSGKSLTAYNFIWSYEDEVTPINPNFERVRKTCKKVYQYDFNYNLINEFISTNEAALKTKVELKNIQAVCGNKRQTAGGFYWSYTKIKKEKNMIQLYADGSCKKNPGIGGCACVLIYGEHRKEIQAGYKLTTNNRMELRAVIMGLEAIKKKNSKITVYSDSRYVTNAFKKEWIFNWEKENFHNRVNSDLFIRLLELYRSFASVEFVWVKGHNGNIENERCDFLATQMSSNNPQTEDIGYISEK